MMRSRLTLLVIVLLVLCLVAVAAACTQQDSPGPESSPTAQAVDAAEAPILYSLVDFETYSSIVDLSGVADLVIVGTVDRVAGHDLDYGTSDPEEKQNHRPTPVVYYEVSVAEALKGSADGSSIIVVRPDAAEVYNEDSTPLNPGHSVVLFLKKRTYTPGITTYKDSVIYVPVSMDNGVFDVADNAPEGFDGRIPGNTVVTPRGQKAVMFGEGATYTMAEVRQAIP